MMYGDAAYSGQGYRSIQQRLLVPMNDSKFR